MSKLSAFVVLLGCSLIGAAIIYHAGTSRYAVMVLTDVSTVRLDTRTGATAFCYRQKIEEEYAFVCGRSH